MGVATRHTQSHPQFMRRGFRLAMRFVIVSLIFVFFTTFINGTDKDISPAETCNETAQCGMEFPNTGDIERLPDQPIQLVRPDPKHHKMLEVIADNIRHLHYIETGVAVIAVVGKFHSGKSFLLNQLMGKKDGFGVGPSVRPHTMGIWMWGKPVVLNTSSGETLSVIYLDTEGFAATNISEVYDAKIFAVSTILSSYLIYNSVKIIDQGDIDYLDLLARRTRLFALRSQITKSKWFDEFNHDLLHFPPLIWVIQDFVQTTDDFETPQDWLHRIMTSSSRESEEHNINLLSMFESVNCHTLFLPATKKALLQDLSTATEMDLTPEYKEERDSLLKLIKSKLKPKVKNGKVITGPELASLLEILVAAANEGSLAEVPSRWNAFLEQMHLGSVEDCIRYYESEINVLLKKRNFEAINATELLLWHQVSLEKSEDLLDKLLFGMQNESFKTKLKLIKSCNEKYEKIRDINEKKIELKCGETQRKIEIEVVEYFEDMTYPIKKKKMSSIFNDAKEKFSEDYILEVGYLSDHSSYDTYLNLLMISIDRIFNGVKLKNNEAMEIILKAAINKAIDVFRTESRNVNEIPRTTQIIKEVIDKANGEAKKVFELESSVTHDEDVYQLYVKYYQSEIDTEAGKVREENLQLVHGKCANKIVELEKTYRENTSPRKLTFPLNESYLEARLKEESDTIYKAYAESLAEFNDMSPFFDVQRQLVDKVHGICDERRDQNYKAYIKEVETPLQTAVKLIKLTSDKYDTEFSFQYYMEQVCLLHLDEGKASSWSLSLKKSIIRRYISSHKELQELLSNKAGLWSRVKGFFQWIYSLIF